MVSFSFLGIGGAVEERGDTRRKDAMIGIKKNSFNNKMNFPFLFLYQGKTDG